MPMYRHVAEITFTGAFPVDMLRYDCCYPATEEDANKIQASVNYLHERVRGKQIVTVIQRSDSRTPRWTMARWNSFSAAIMEKP